MPTKSPDPVPKPRYAPPGVGPLVAGLPPARRALYRAGAVLLLGALGLALALWFFQGSFHREWINPWSAEGAGTQPAARLTVALVGTIGLPPFLLYVTLGVFVGGWTLLLAGLAGGARVRVAWPWLLLLGAHAWLLASAVPGWREALAVTLVAGQALCLAATRRFPRAAGGAAQAALLAGFALVLALAAPSRMDLALAVAGSQLFTVALLVLFWFVLGYDAFSGALALGRWVAGSSRAALGAASLVLLSLLTAAAAAWLFMGKGLLLMPFATTLLAGNALVLLAWLRRRRPPESFAANLLVLSLLAVFIVFQGLGALSPSLELLTLPIVLYALATVWSFWSSAPLFAARSTPSLPAGPRLFLHLGWSVLATGCFAFFVGARDDLFMRLSDRIGAEALLVIGVPTLAWLLVRRRHEVLPGLVQPANTTAGGRRWPFAAFLLLALGLGALVHASRGLAVVEYTTVAATMARGNAALVAGDNAGALAAYRAAARPGDFKPPFMEGVALWRLARLPEAEAALSNAVALRDDAVDAWLSLGAVRRELGRYRDAQAAYERALALDPADSFGWRNLGLCFAYLGRHEDAKRCLYRALALLPGRNEFGNSHWPALGFAYLLAGKARAAIPPLAKALRLNPRDALALHDMGLAWKRLGDPARAASYLRRALDAGPRDRRAVADALAGALAAAGRLADLAAFYAAERVRRPAEPELALFHLRLLKRLDRRDEFDRESRAAVASFPRHADLLALRAESLLGDRQAGAAESLLARALAVDPRNRNALLQAAYARRLAKDYGAAFTLYRRLLAVDPAEPNALLFGGLLAAGELGRWAEAADLLGRLLAQPGGGGDKRVTALRYYGLACFRLKPPRIEDGLAAYRTILRLTADGDFDAAANLAIVYGALKRTADEAAMLGLVIRLRPAVLLQRVQLGMALEKLARAAEAAAVYGDLRRRLSAMDDAAYDAGPRAELKNFPRTDMLEFLDGKLRALAPRDTTRTTETRTNR